MACIGPLYTFQSSGTAGGNAYDSVVMSPIANGSIRLLYKLGSTTVYTQFLKVLPLILSRSGNVLNWTDVGVESYTLTPSVGDPQTINATTYTAPSTVFPNTYTVTCDIDGQTLPQSNSVTVPGVTPTIVFQSSQGITFAENNVLNLIQPGSYSITTLLANLNIQMQSLGASFSYNSTDGRVTFTPPESGVTFAIIGPINSDGTSSPTSNFLSLVHLGFALLQDPPDISLGQLITTPVTASNVLTPVVGDVPPQPPKMTFTVTDITTTSFTVSYADPADAVGVQVVYGTNGTYSNVSASTNSSPIVVTDLIPGTIYEVFMQGLSFFDYGIPSDPQSVTTLNADVNSSWLFTDSTEEGYLSISGTPPNSMSEIMILIGNLRSNTQVQLEEPGYPSTIFANDALSNKNINLTYFSGASTSTYLIKGSSSDGTTFTLNVEYLSGEDPSISDVYTGSPITMEVFVPTIDPPTNLKVDDETILNPLFSWDAAVGTNPSGYTVRLLVGTNPAGQDTTSNTQFQLGYQSGQFAIPYYYTQSTLQVSATENGITSEYASLPIFVEDPNGVSVPQNLFPSNITDTSFTIGWYAPSGTTYYPPFTYTVQITDVTTDIPVVIQTTTDITDVFLNVTGLTAGHSYVAAVKTVVGSYSSTYQTYQVKTTGFTFGLSLATEPFNATNVSSSTGLGSENAYEVICSGDGKFELSGTVTGNATLHFAFSPVSTMQSDPGFDAAIPNPETEGTFMTGNVLYSPINFGDPATLATTDVDVLGQPETTVYTNQNIGSNPFKITGTVRSIGGTSYIDYPCFKVWVTGY